MPLFVWAQVVMSFMIVFAMPPLMLVSVELMLDRLVGTHFFNPAAGGDALLWQHLFWIFGHPDVYIILIPALGVVSMIVPAAARRPIAGYLAIATSTVAIGFLSFGLWVHHMYATGVPLLGMNFFAAVGMMITIPNAVQIFAWIATIWRGRLRVTTPFLWVVGFLVVFILGGITGIMVASPPFDWQAHDTYFVVAHFHYVLVGGAVFPLLGAVEFWFPKASGRLLGERAGRASFWLTFVGFNVAFLPMHLTGLLGMPRRVYTYLPGLGWDGLNLVSTLGAFGMALGIGVFAVNVLASLRRGRRAGPDPWGAGTLEWATSSPPPPYNFSAIPVVRDRNPLWTGGDAGAPATVEGLALGLEPGARRREVVVTTVLDAAPDHLAYLPGPSAWPFWAATGAAVAFLGSMVHFALVGAGAAIAFVSLVGWLWPRAEVVPPPRHGPLPRVVPGHGETVWWGMLLLITIEVTVFASLVFTYFYLRAGAPRWPLGDIAAPPLLLPTVNTAVLLASLVPVAWADRAIRRGDRRAVLVGKPIGQALLVAFLAIKAVEYGGYDYTWATNAYGSVVWTITGFHVAHVIVALLKSAVVTVLAARGYFTEERFLGVQANALYWYFVALVWIPLYATLYLTPRLLG
jgi:cytochrome c oxidase subunit 1/cytochrome c oxidase subunit I+III